MSDVWDAIFNNGPIYAGAVVGTDDYVGSRDGFKALASRADTDAVKDLALRFATVANARVASAVAGIVYFISFAPGVAADTSKCAEEPAWYPAADAKPAGAPPAFDLAGWIRDGLSLIVVTKVNYWKTNHHVGQGGITAYLNKLLAGWEITAADDQTVKLIWRAAHWADTRIVLSCLGIKFDAATDQAAAPLRKLFAPSDDAVLRIRSNPAGTAKWADSYAAIQYAVSGIDGQVVTREFFNLKQEDHETAAALKEGNPAYHMGSLYLVGRERIVLEDFPERLVSAAVTIMRSKNPNHTLLKSPHFRDVGTDGTIAKRLGKVTNTVAAADCALVAAYTTGPDVAKTVAKKVSDDNDAEVEEE